MKPNHNSYRRGEGVDSQTDRVRERMRERERQTGRQTDLNKSGFRLTGIS